ncbi:hypothetical protein AMTR_s00021p00017700 [Amborella trichopoda]|uniref:Uncharacterized protein n=1 Tax=Amborella trichopoda TaxID=13333 RepID=W1Q057_AMBTC|nr:hypothetical protein AMTR_s00021p00017700 [Amborella trichopoda]
MAPTLSDRMSITKEQILLLDKMSLSTAQVVEEGEEEVVRTTPLQLLAIRKVGKDNFANGGLM